ncbi:hypothetical protein [Streptomyces sp. NPDC017260]
MLRREYPASRSCEPTLAELGPVLSVTEHQDWEAALAAVDALPVAARALV